MSQTIQEITIIPYDQISTLTIDDVAQDNPMLDEDQFLSLKEDIKANGQLNPVVIYENRIIDGRNRVEAIKALKLDLKAVIVNGTYEEAVKLAQAYNDKRRHMSKSQFAMRAAYAIQASREDKSKKKISIDNVPELKNKLVSKRYVEAALKILETDPESAKKVFDGEIDVSDALRSLSVKAAGQTKPENDTITYLQTTYSEEAAEAYCQRRS